MKRKHPKCGNCGKKHDPKSKLCQIIGPYRHGAPASRQRPEGWPMVSTAMAVNIEQVELAQKKDRELGAPPTEYKADREGYSAQPVFTSEAHKRQFIKAHGMHDRNSFC